MQQEKNDSAIIWTTLQEVMDPEIPVVSMVEMGMIYQVFWEREVVTIEVLPTFVGCPALEIMQKAIEQKVSAINRVDKVIVRFLHTPAWSSDRINPDARRKLRQFGIAPPPLGVKVGDKWEIECPFCDSPYTELENLFGPAACRSILYCRHCKNPFEALKPI
ncbi:1,2-phenylacetyl-CoA epoxidase subunit PaaD [Risungbinella massiliensis]|uniref:1,2-phenylacetyl-CoA epoxidase subunit PaaD n=1 Tax=Risungbinella massiliensis TaxID=1329796 RepID=UPI0005CC78C4|nr:1,2-phenylacetyl-CoA epoxidase subunit PaaD [Risungbinella massiliensis]